MKFLDLIKTANNNLFRNKLRTILTILAIFIGGFVITLMVGVNAGVNDYVNQQLGAIGGDNLLVVSAKQDNALNTSSGPAKYNPNQSNIGGFSLRTLNPDDVAKIKTVAHIANVTPQLNANATWMSNDRGGDKYSIAVGQMVDGINVNLAAGRAPDNSSPSNEIVLLTSEISALGFSDNNDAIGANVLIGVTQPTGDIVPVTAKVVGVQNASLLSSGGDRANNATIQQMFDLQTDGMSEQARNQFTAVAVTLKDGLSQKDIEQVKSDIEGLGNYRAQSIKDTIGTVSTIINAITIALIGFGAVALLAASFGIINTLFMSVQERTKEIGLMKAMGMGRRKVFALFSIEAILIGFWGSLVSVLAAIGVGKIINNIASNTFLKDLQGFTLLKFPIISVVTVMLVVMLIAFLAGTLPARRASKKDPIEALRYE
jgi:putative ABC transport system permease protein